jgi:heptosyltransferase-1
VIEMRSGVKRAAAIVSDRLLTAIAPALVPSRVRAAPPSGPRVLLVRCDHIGDAVMATPMLEPLHDALGPSRLDVLVGPWSEALFRSHPLIDDVISYATPWWIAARGGPLSERAAAWAALAGVVRRLRARQYDIAIDLRGDLRQIAFFLVGSGAPVRASTNRTGGAALLTHVSPYDRALHEVEQNAAVIGRLGVASPEYRLDVRFDRGLPGAVVDAMREASGPRGLVALSFRSREPSHSWPAEHAVQLVEAARSRLGLGAVYVGGPGDRPFGDAIARAARTPIANLAGRTALLETIAVFAATQAAIVVDSGPMHLAACAGVPLIALFGPSRPAQVRPWTPNARVVTDGAPCGCIHPTCDFTSGPGRCLAALTPERVMEALAGLVGVETES